MIKSDKIKYKAGPIQLDATTPEIKSSSIKTPPIQDPNKYSIGENTETNLKIFASKYTRDYYRGKSFHYAGHWMTGVHYVDDYYSTDFVDLDNALLVCIKGHFSSSDNKPVFNYNSRGDVESIVSDHWNLVLTGIHGKSPGIRYNEELQTIEICEDTSVPEEEQVWVAIDGWVPKSGGTFEGPVTFDALSTFVAGAKFNDNVGVDGALSAGSGLSTDSISSISGNGIELGDSVDLNGNSIVGDQGVSILSDNTEDGGVTLGSPNLTVTLTSSNAIQHSDGNDIYKILDTSAQTLTEAEKTQVRTNIGATSSGDVDAKINALDGTITKTAGSASTSTAANAYQKVPVVSGFVLREVNGKLVETNATSSPSTVTIVDVDIAGSAQKAFNDAKDYADDLIEGLGSIMHFEGTVATEAALKALTNVKKGDVYVVTADHSEWVATADIGATADATKWEKFGTTDVQGALYKTTTSGHHYTSGEILVADGTSGAVRSVTLDEESGNDITVGTEVALGLSIGDSGETLYVQKSAMPAASADDFGLVKIGTGIAVNSGVISANGSGSVGTASSSSDAWKTVVHDASLSGATLSGNTKSIPAATPSNDGYMTTTQATDVTKSVAKVDGISHGAGNHEINSYCECSTSASTAAKTASLVSGDISGFAAGLRVAVKFTNANTANNPTLNISSTSPAPGSTGAKNIFVNGTQITTGSNKGLLRGVCIFIYDGTQWHLIGGGSDYSAGDGLTLTDHTFAVDYSQDSYALEQLLDNAWKNPVVIDEGQHGPELTINGDGALIINGYYSPIPASMITSGNTTTYQDGYMTAIQAEALTTAIQYLTWEEPSQP